MTGDESDRTTWRGRPTSLPAGQSGLTLGFPPILPEPPYPRRDGRPLRGWARFRFRLTLLSYGHSVSSLQRTARINVDGIPGVQTWVAFYAIIRRGRR